MACTSPRWVTAGFYRVHLWVGLGLNTFVAGIVFLLPEFEQRQTRIAAGDRRRNPQLRRARSSGCTNGTLAGQWALVLVALIESGRGAGSSGRIPGVALQAGVADGRRCADVRNAAGNDVDGHAVGALVSEYADHATVAATAIGPADRGGGLGSSGGRRGRLGFVFSPGDRRVDSVRPAGAPLVRRALAGVLGLTAMTWQTLKIPNTQSATGILYVAVIFAFLGELTSQLLSVHVPHLV